MSAILLFKDSITFFIAASAIAGLVTWRKWKGNYLKWMPVYLIVLLLCEIAGYYWGLHKNYNAVRLLYQFFVIPMEISFVCRLFYNSLPVKFRKLTFVMWLIYLLCWLLEISIFKNSSHVFLSLSYTIGNVVILILLLCYFINLVTSDDILNFKTDIMFWISTGMLLFYLGTFPYYGLYNIMAEKYLGSFINYTWIMIFLNYSMYSLFIAGFIWGKAK